MADQEQPAERVKTSRDDGENNDVGTITPSYITLRDATDPETFREAVWGRVFNRRRDMSRVPRAVIQVSCVPHVREAVELANRQRCRVSVRSGGHSWAAWSVRQDAILLDLGQLRHMVYNERTKIVSCSPSVTGEQLNDFLKTEGRMFAGGHCPEVGLGGFLLQGGMGWNCKVRWFVGKGDG
jgi:FAD/FMN-containing dehydrogenase